MRFLRAVRTLFVLTLTIVIGFLVIALTDPGVQATQPARATVEIRLEGSLGSGVHIGNGVFLTAAHVVKDQAKITVRTERGEDLPATLLWLNTQYDLAMITVAAPGAKYRIRAVTIRCRDARVGDEVYAVGNPMGVEFIESYGHVAGPARQIDDAWKSAIMIDMAVAPGMSGGPLLDASTGELVGVVTGVMVSRIGPFPSLVGFGYAVPSSAVCMLQGRSA